MSTKPPEPVILIHLFTVCILTTEEYEQLRQEVLSRHIVEDKSIGDRILAQVLLDNEYRYNECVQIKKSQAETKDIAVRKKP